MRCRGYLWDGFTDALGDLVRLRALGVVIVLATLAWLVWQLTRRPIPRTLLVPAALALGAGVSLALTAWRRGAIGESRDVAVRVHHHRPDAPAARRGHRLVHPAPGPDAVAVVVAAGVGVLLLVGVIAQVRMFDDYVAAIEPVKEVEKGALLNTAVLAAKGTSSSPITPCTSTNHR